MTRTPIRLTLLAIALSLICWNVAAAQIGEPDPAVWPRVVSVDKVDIVTFAANGRAVPCTVASIDENQIACARTLGHKAVIYRREEVASLVSERYHYSPLRSFAVWFGSGAGIVTGAAFLASVTLGWGIAVAVIGGIVLLTSPFAFADGTTDTPAKLLYRAPRDPSQMATN